MHLNLEVLQGLDYFPNQSGKERTYSESTHIFLMKQTFPENSNPEL